MHSTDVNRPDMSSYSLLLTPWQSSVRAIVPFPACLINLAIDTTANTPICFMVRLFPHHGEEQGMALDQRPEYEDWSGFLNSGAAIAAVADEVPRMTREQRVTVRDCARKLTDLIDDLFMQEMPEWHMHYGGFECGQCGAISPTPTKTWDDLTRAAREDERSGRVEAG
jgi:hypothetical protein